MSRYLLAPDRPGIWIFRSPPEGPQRPAVLEIRDPKSYPTPLAWRPWLFLFPAWPADESSPKVCAAPAPLSAPDVLAAPCQWCGYDGPEYWQSGTHRRHCRWRTVGGADARRAIFARDPYVPPHFRPAPTPPVPTDAEVAAAAPSRWESVDLGPLCADTAARTARRVLSLALATIPSGLRRTGEMVDVPGRELLRPESHEAMGERIVAALDAWLVVEICDPESAIGRAVREIAEQPRTAPAAGDRAEGDGRR